PVSGIVTIDMLSAAIDHIYEHGMQRGCSPGWPSVAQHYTVRPGEFTIVTGIPSHGKSQWVSAMAVNLALTQGWRMAFFSPEHFPMERYAAILMELYAGQPFDGPSSRMSRQTLAEAKAWMQEHISFLMPEDDAPTVQHLLSLARVQV